MADYSNKVATGDSIAALTMVVKPAIEAKQDEITLTNKLDPALVATDANNAFVTDAQKTAWTAKQDAISATNKVDPDFIATDSDASFVSATEKSTWSGKQDAITSTNKLSTSLVNTDNNAQFVSATEKSTWNNKADTSDIPTATSDLTNDSDFQTSTQVSSAIASAISGLTGFHFEIVQALPQTGETNVIYLVLKSSSETGNIYTEYAWINNAWETLGDTSVDIDPLTTTDINTIWNSVT